jgi:SAM-dependent methyltransferase
MPEKLTIPAYDDALAASRYGKRRGTTRAELRVLGRLVPPLGPGSVVLDVPCGNGRLAPFLRALRPRVLLGIDGAAAMAGRAAPAYDRALVGDVAAMPVADRSVDLVLCSRLLHHFPDAGDRAALLRELARVSRGLVVFSFYRSATLEGLRRRFRLKRRSARVGLPLRRIRAECRAAGLSPIRVASLCPLVRGRRSRETGGFRPAPSYPSAGGEESGSSARCSGIRRRSRRPWRRRRPRPRGSRRAS